MRREAGLTTLPNGDCGALAGLPQAHSAPSTELADQWRRLTRAATAVAVLTSPALFIWFKEYNGWSTLGSLAATVGVGNIDRLTRPRVFEYEFQQTQEGNAVLVLTPAALEA